MRPPYWFALVLAAATAGALWWSAHRPASDPRVLPDDAVDPAETYSNILPADYVGPRACAGCHREQFDLWSAHPHRRMNQLPTPEAVLGDFRGATLRLPTGSVRFTGDAGGYFMSVEKDGTPVRRYRVTRTVGSVVMQYYIGREVDGPEPADHPARGEHMLPFAWWATLGRWLPKDYLDPNGPEDLAGGRPTCEGIDHLRDVRPYNAVCMNCHNTYPYAYRIFSPMFVGFPGATVSAAVGPLSRELGGALSVEPTAAGFAGVPARLDPDRHLVTLGISCESCHLGGREHARGGKPVRFLPTSRYVRVTPAADRPLTPGRDNPATVSGLCTQCHSALTKCFPNGAGEGNSREGRDFAAGACSGKLSCTGCHEPHTASPPSGGPTPAAHLATCRECHPRYADPAAAAAHSRHSAAVDCLDCHMPRQVLGLDTLVRTHRIGKPVEEQMAAAGSANACNLCHLDRSLGWTLAELKTGWGSGPAPDPSWASWPARDRPLGEQWLRGPDAHLRFVAAMSYARSPLGKDRLPDLLRGLNDPEPVNRVYLARAVGQARGRPLTAEEFDITAAPADRLRQIDAMMAKLRRP